MICPMHESTMFRLVSIFINRKYVSFFICKEISHVKFTELS